MIGPTTTSSEQPATAGQSPNGNQAGAAGNRRVGRSYNGLPVLCLARQVGDKSAGLPTEPTQVAMTVRLEEAGDLVAEWLLAGGEGDLRRPLLRRLGAAVAELNDRCAGQLRGGRTPPMERRTFKLTVCSEGETLGDWRISGYGATFTKKATWAIFVVILGVDAEHIEFRRVGLRGSTRRKVGAYARARGRGAISATSAPTPAPAPARASRAPNERRQASQKGARREG